MVYRLIAPEWLRIADPYLKPVLEGEFTLEEIQEFNGQGYNVYLLPNYPSIYDPKEIVSGKHIDTFSFAFVDMDLKDGVWKTKEEFIDVIHKSGIEPALINDSGNGIHVFYQITDLDSMSYLKFQRRLTRLFKTDEAVSKIYQLMRMPDTYNTKDPVNKKLCQTIYSSDKTYTCEEFNRLLPIITAKDEEYCKQHHDRTYNKNDGAATVDDKMPAKWGGFLLSSREAKDIWNGNVNDRSKSDWRLGHLMFAYGFTKQEALSVLVNSQKALERAPAHRVSYATGIVDKIWTFENEGQNDNRSQISMSVRDILRRSGDSIKGTRFPCHRFLDATRHGFRLGQVIGLVAGSGVGKTAVALNMFKWFVERNPDYTHFFVPLEQPANEIADRWRTLCDGKETLHDKVHVISNYDDDGRFRHLSFDDIKSYILSWQQTTGLKAGSIVIDHIGALNKKGPNGENQDLMDICHKMKSFAIETNTLLIMQSQAPREKAGGGDIELDKDAAYGTVYFESYCDYLITCWQPLKKCYGEKGCPTVTAYKFCKIRHKKQGQDEVQEDVPYRLFFEPGNETLRAMTEVEEKAFDFWNTQATNKRKRDKKTDVLTYKSVTWDTSDENI